MTKTSDENEETDNLIRAIEFAAESAPALTRQWGKEAQIVVAIGEMGELLAELADTWRGRTTEEKVRSEIADVLFCAVQLASIFGFEEVASDLGYKVSRTNAKALMQRMEANQPKGPTT